MNDLHPLPRFLLRKRLQVFSDLFFRILFYFSDDKDGIGLFG